MKPLFDLKLLENAISDDKFPFECEYCGETFYTTKRQAMYKLNKTRNTARFCSIDCCNLWQKLSFDTKCAYCEKIMKRRNCELKKSKSNNQFCSHSCAAKYNNAHKSHGIRISKLEIWLQKKLGELFPNLEILYNDKKTINSELDIYIPSLKLAFELNGIYHYEPIYGKEKLGQIQNNDNRKYQACLERGIILCIIDTSQQKYFKEKTSQKYLDIIIKTLNSLSTN